MAWQKRQIRSKKSTCGPHRELPLLCTKSRGRWRRRRFLLAEWRSGMITVGILNWIKYSLIPVQRRSVQRCQPQQLSRSYLWNAQIGSRENRKAVNSDLNVKEEKCFNTIQFFFIEWRGVGWGWSVPTSFPGLYYELTKWPAARWLDSSVSRALQRYRRSEVIFQALISQLLKLWV